MDFDCDSKSDDAFEFGNQQAGIMKSNRNYSHSSSIRRGPRRGATASTMQLSSPGMDSARSMLPTRKRKRPFCGGVDNQQDEQDRDEEASTSSSRSASFSNAASGSKSSTRYVITRNAPVSLRRANPGAHAVQDAGTYQMLHDECSYLCSTILSPRNPPSKVLDAAIELTTLISSRKTRSLLWQTGGFDPEDESKPLARSPGRGVRISPTRTTPPIPKVWCSILEVLAVLTQATIITPRKQQQQQQQDLNSSTFRGDSSDASCTIEDQSLGEGPAVLPTPVVAGNSIISRRRTKSARRKEKELSLPGGIAGIGMGNRTPAPPISASLAPPQLTDEMREVLAYLVYFLSWDCTLSEEHSVAAIGSVKVPSVAGRMRMAFLENGAALSGIMKLMSPSLRRHVASTSARDCGDEVGTLIGSSFSVSSVASSAQGSKQSTRLGRCTDPSTMSPSAASPFRSLKAQSRSGRSSPFGFMPSIHRISSAPFAEEADSSFNLLEHGGDPTAFGRRNRKSRRMPEMASQRQKQQHKGMDSVPELQFAEASDSVCFGTDSLNDEVALGIKSMPPPSNRHVKPSAKMTRASRSIAGQPDKKNEHKCELLSEEHQVSFQGHGNRSIRVQPRGGTVNSSLSWDDDEGQSTVASTRSGNTILVTDGSTKISALRSKVVLESTTSANVTKHQQDLVHAERNLERNHETFHDGDHRWISLVCLESLTRIVMGKDDGGKSCLEEHEESGAGRQGDTDIYDLDDEEDCNPFIVTNRLLGKSGIIPLLALAMSESLAYASKLPFYGTSMDYTSSSTPCQGGEFQTGELSCAHWKYSLDRLSLLASLIDGACLFCEENRRGFCENDPFSFEKRNQGLIYEILVFVRKCCRHDMNKLEGEKSAILLLALRTLTSLSHENTIAAEQMTFCYSLDNERPEPPENSLRGIDVLVELIFELEESSCLPSNSVPRTRSIVSMKRANDYDMHRYDCTIFCLNTLANIIEGAGARRILAETNVITRSGSRSNRIPWLKWLCRWLVKQTESFRDEILAIGKTVQHSSPVVLGCHENSTLQQAQTKNNTELQRDEEEKLVAAGNGCVLLACLMTEPECDDPESCTTIRRLIIDEMPFHSDGSSSGVAMIINTLKAFCNYYHLSLGDLSVAVVAPVKKLIKDLEELENFDHSLDK